MGDLSVGRQPGVSRADCGGGGGGGRRHAPAGSEQSALVASPAVGAGDRRAGFSLQPAPHRPGLVVAAGRRGGRSEEHTSELQSLMRISYAVFCLKKKNKRTVKLDLQKVSKQTA